MKTCKTLGRISISVLLALVMLVSSFVGMITISAEETETEASAGGITGISVSLENDIIVNFKADAGTGDSSKVKVTFNEKEFEITQNTQGVFQFVNVTPQNLGDEIKAQMYNEDGTTAGKEVTFSVQSYLEGFVNREYRDELCKCTSKLQHTALQELCVNMLNYGAAAQTYINHDVENLANKNLTPEQQALATAPITVTESDKAVNGSAWVGAGVRFDYNLGLYFVFRAESIDEYTVTVNGMPVSEDNNVSVAEYPALGENAYVIRYNGFNAINMNDVVTAKLTKGEDVQTFAYSVKSYVASKGGDTSNIATLVNAMYTYGFAAVAYSAEYITVAPTFETTGSLTMDAKGYDFSGTKYGSVELPKLNNTDYATNTVNKGNEAAPSIVTEFIYDPVMRNQTVAEVDGPDHCVNINGTLASVYDYEKFNYEKRNEEGGLEEGLEVDYDETTGYTVTATNAELKALATYGAELTIKGTLTMDLTTPEGGTAPTWTLYKNTTLGDGTEAGKATVTVKNAAGNGVVLNGSTADMLVTKASSLTDSSISVNKSSLIVDGTVTVGTRITAARSAIQASGDYETGYKPSVYVCNGGTLTAGTIKTFSLQVGSLVDSDTEKARLVLTGEGALLESKSLIGNINGDDRNYHKRFFFLYGQIDASSDVANSTLLCPKCPGNGNYTAQIDIRKEMVINLGKNMYGFGYTNQNSNSLNYIIFWEDGAQLNTVDTQGAVTGKCNNLFRVYQQTLYVYSWTEADVKLSTDATETTKVLIAGRKEYTANGSSATSGTGNYAKTADMVVIPTVTAKTVLTDTLTEGKTTTVNTSVLGTLTQATYTDENGNTVVDKDGKPIYVYYRVFKESNI